MSERGAHALVTTIKGWVWIIGQPLLVLLVFAAYYLQARTTEGPVQVSVNRRATRVLVGRRQGACKGQR